MSRTTRFQILVVLRLPTFDSNFATLDNQNKHYLSKHLFFSGPGGGGGALGAPLALKNSQEVCRNLELDPESFVFSKPKNYKTIIEHYILII